MEAKLSRREREIMDVVFAWGQATVAEIAQGLSDPPMRGAIRTMLRILEEKGHLTHRKEGREFVYLPTRAPQVEGRSAMRRVLEVFFGGSLEKALAAYLSGGPETELSPDELKQVQELIEKARKEGR